MLRVLTKPVVVVLAAVLMAAVTGPPVAMADAAPLTSTYASLDGEGLLGAAALRLGQYDVAVTPKPFSPLGITFLTDIQGWRTGTFSVTPSGSVRARWSGDHEYAEVTGTLTVTRAVLDVDGVPVEFAAVLTGTRPSGSTTVPVRAIVVYGSVATGLPAYIVGDPGSISVKLPRGSDQTKSVALRNVGGTAGAVTTVQVASTFVSPPQFSAWSAPTTCLNVQILPAGRCTTGVRVQYETAAHVIGYPLAAATWRGAGGLVTTVQLSGDWPTPDDPTLSMTAPTLVHNTATVTLRASDPQASDTLKLHCRLDNAAFVPCAASWSLTGLSNGIHTVTAYVTDPAGHMSEWQRTTITADSLGPVTTMASPTTLVSLGNPLLVSWNVTDPGIGPKSVQARRRWATATTTYGAFVVPSCCTASLSNGVTVTPAQGVEQCWSARSVDRFNQWGAWSSERCFLAPLDDRKLASRGFIRESSYTYKGWKSTARRTGATLSLSNVRTRQVGLLVSTCPTCGSLDVYVGSRRLGRVYTRRTISHTRVVIWLPKQAVERRGTLVIRSTSSKRVVVDGVLIRHR